MNKSNSFSLAIPLALALAIALAAPAHAAVVISEVAPWSSGSSPVGADWFEVTNTGSSAVAIGGWKVDDNSNSFAASVALRGITSIAAGQSVIFIEGLADGSTDAALKAGFVTTWFGATAPAGLQIGNYGGAGVGLGTSGDAVNLFDAAGVLQAAVSFGASPAGPVFATFDNAAGLNNGVISQLAVAGVNGAFAAIGDAAEIGSPGRVSAVPESSSLALMLGGLGMLGLAARRFGAGR